MGLTTLSKSPKYKRFMSMLYGIGASIVIIGALFKITHWEGANLFLSIGLITEAVIFFFSAFEQPFVDPDWSLVHPQMAHLYHPGEKSAPPIKHAKTDTVAELDNLLAKGGIDQKLIESLSSGIRNLSDNASKLSQVGSAVVATGEFTQNVQAASQNVKNLSDSYRRSAESLNLDADAKQEYLQNLKSASQSIATLTNIYNQTAATVQNDLSATEQLTSAVKNAASSAVALSEHYTQTAQFMAKSVNELSTSSANTHEYTEQVKKIAQNMQALNAVYEIQLKSVHDQVSNAEQLKASVTNFIGTINSSNNEMESYKKEVDTLNANVKKLNNIYGNMINAMKS
jgi:gliding motility-associated protein GldL